MQMPDESNLVIYPFAVYKNRKSKNVVIQPVFYMLVICVWDNSSGIVLIIAENKYLRIVGGNCNVGFAVFLKITCFYKI